MLTTAVAAAQIISKATTALNAARERAKGSKDTDLKIHINTLYDEFLNLKELLIRLTDENSEPPREHAGLVRRHCVVCQQYFTEKSDDEPAFGIANGPNGWMGR